MPRATQYRLQSKILGNTTAGIFKYLAISDNTALMQNAYNIILYFIRECFPSVIHVKLALFEFYASKICGLFSPLNDILWLLDTSPF